MRMDPLEPIFFIITRLHGRKKDSVFCFLKETVFLDRTTQDFRIKAGLLFTIGGQETTVKNELKNLIKTD